MMKRILTILGARPQFIKAGMLSRALLATDDFQELILHTGQHFDKNMSEIFFKEMEIPLPHYNLNISGLNHGAMTGRMMEDIEKIVLEVTPSAILVYGDTNSTLAGALVGSKLHVPVIHVEAGLRSFNMKMPEEINRILTDRMSSLLLCPTEQSLRNLKNEGFDNFDGKVELVGDIMQDAALFYGARSEEFSNILEDNGLVKGGFALITCHRAENTNDKMKLDEIIQGINDIAKNNTIVWPVHPRLTSIIQGYQLSENIKCIDPVGYFDMVELLKNCSVVLTDSGGLQKEAYFFKKYCITLREQTEWVELVSNKCNTLVGADSLMMFTAYNEFVNKDFYCEKELYGAGCAANNIITSMKDFLI